MSNARWHFSFILHFFVVYLLRQIHKGIIIMKAYGHSRHDKIECKYGCCTTKSGKAKNCRSLVDRANRKTARQSGVKEITVRIRESLIVED